MVDAVGVGMVLVALAVVNEQAVKRHNCY